MFLVKEHVMLCMTSLSSSINIIHLNALSWDKKTPVETNNSPQYLAVRIASETLIPTQLYMNVNESDPRSNVHYSSSSENKAWKNSGLYEIWTHDLCDTGAAFYQLS